MSRAGCCAQGRASWAPPGAGVTQGADTPAVHRTRLSGCRPHTWHFDLHESAWQSSGRWGQRAGPATWWLPRHRHLPLGAEGPTAEMPLGPGRSPLHARRPRGAVRGAIWWGAPPAGRGAGRFRLLRRTRDLAPSSLASLPHLLPQSRPKVTPPLLAVADPVSAMGRRASPHARKLTCFLASAPRTQFCARARGTSRSQPPEGRSFLRGARPAACALCSQLFGPGDLRGAPVVTCEASGL